MIAVVAAMFLTAAVGEAVEEVQRFAVVVANSRSLTPDVRPLEFADDDAARYAEMFDHIADEVQLIAVLDADIQRVYPAQAARAQKPDRATLLAALSKTFARIAAANRAGRRTIFYFVMIGHGEIGPGGEGYVSLLDAPFSRADLYGEVLSKSPATTNHVIIDACNSYFLVNRRGADDDDSGPSRAEAVRDYMNAEQLSKYPNTGVLLSTSSAKESHEWSGYAAGVFSHEVRSAMTGAADANGDGVVDYSEVHAFIAAANLRVDDPRARVEMFAVPPSLDIRQGIVDLRRARFAHFLAVPPGRELRFYLEDDRGVRYADVHLTGEVPAYLALLSRSHYYVRTPDEMTEERIDLHPGARPMLDFEKLRPMAIKPRGAVGETFQQKLFREAYGPRFYAGFAAANGYAPAESPAVRFDPAAITATAELGMPPSEVAGWIVLGSGALLAGGAAWAALESESAENEFESHVGPNGVVTGLTPAQVSDLEGRAKSFAWLRNGLAIGALVAVAAGGYLALWPSPTEGGGATLALWGRF